MTDPETNTGSRIIPEYRHFILVEGKDEVNLLEALKRELPSRYRRFGTIEAGGKDQFRVRLRALLADERRDGISAIGVMRDADRNAESAFESVKNGISGIDLMPPEKHGRYSDGVPRIGIFIAPDGESEGSIESLCRLSVENDGASLCAKDYIDCLGKRGLTRWSDNNRAMEDKAFMHAFLASLKDPLTRAGEAALQGIWNFDDEAFVRLVEFVKDLFGQKVDA